MISILLLIGVLGYAVWAIHKIRIKRKKGGCCSGNCNNCKNSGDCA